MGDKRTPVSIAYCREVKCPKRSGNKCTLIACMRAGAEKWAMYFEAHGHLANGDVPDA